MNKIVKITISIFLVLILLIGCSNSNCSSDNAGVCDLEQIVDFEIEDGAKIKIAVFNESYGKALVSSWNETFSNYQDLLSFEVIASNNQNELLEAFSKYDLIQLKHEDVPLYLDHLKPFDESFSALLNDDNLSKFSHQINQDDNYFMPFEIEGLLFAYNKTMLEELKVDLTDDDENGLVEAIDSFEKIDQLANEWKVSKTTYLDKPLENIFAFPLNDQMAMLSFLQNGDYRLIKGSSAEELDLGNNLLRSLENLAELGKMTWTFNQDLKSEMVWNYDQVLIDQSAPFLLVGNWMYYQHYQQSKAYELVFSKLPTFNGYELATLSCVSGFVLNKDNKYPNAANMVIKHIKSIRGSQIAIDNDIVPLINPALLELEELELSKNLKEQILAYQYSEISPLQAFKQNPKVRGWQVFLENDFRDQITGVFLNEMTPQEAADQIKDIISDWLSENEITIKGLNDQEKIKEESEKTDDDVGKDN